MEAIFVVLAELILSDLIKRPQFDYMRSKLQGDSPQKVALQNAFTKSYENFKDKYPQLSQSFFDEHFLKQRIIWLELSKSLTPNLSPSADLIATVWTQQFSSSPLPNIDTEIKDFLSIFHENLLAEPSLNEFFDSRHLHQIATSTTRMESHLSLLADLMITQHNRTPSVQIDSAEDTYALFQFQEHNLLSNKELQTSQIQPDYVNRCIVGYDDIVNQIKNTDTINKFVILGLSGSGKTALLHKLSRKVATVPVFRYQFRQNLIASKDLLLKLGTFIATIIPELRDVNRILLSDELPEVTKYEFIASVLNQGRCYLLFDSVEYISNNNPIISSFMQILLDRSENYIMVISSQIEPVFISNSDFTSNQFKRIYLRGLNASEVRKFFECKGLEFSDEQIESLARTEEILPIVLDFFVTLFTNKDISDSDIQDTLEKSKSKVADQLFEQIYTALDSEEKQILSILALFAMPIDMSKFYDCALQIVSKAILNRGLNRLKRKVLIGEYASQYLHLHEVVRQLTLNYSELVEGYRLIVSDYLFEQGFDSFELAFEAFQMYFKSDRLDDAAKILTDYTLDFIPFYIDAAQYLLNSFNQDMVTSETWTWIQRAHGDIAMHLRRYDEAGVFYRKMKEIAEIERNNDALSSALLSLGNICYHQSSLAEALAYYQQSLKLYEVDQNEYDQARVLNNVALIQMGQEDFDDALDTLNRSLEILKKLEMPEWRMTNTLGNLGNLHYQLGQLEDADIYIQEVKRIAQEVGDPLKEAQAIYNLGLHEMQRGNKDHARELFENTLKIGEEYNSWQTIELALNALLDVKLQEKNYDSAILILKRIQSIHEEIKNQIGIATAKFKLGTVYLMMEDFDMIIKYYLDAMNYIELLPIDFIDAQLQNIATFASISQNPKNVVELLKNVKNRLCKSDASYALSRIYGALGEIYLNVFQKYHVGKVCLEKEIDLLNELGLTDHQADRLIDLGNTVGGIYNHLQESVRILNKVNDVTDDLSARMRAEYNRGVIYAIGGDYENAMRDFEEVLEYFHQGVSEYKEIEADVLRNLGEIYRYQGKNDQARKMLDSSIQKLRVLGLVDAEIYCLFSLAALDKTIGNKDSALALYSQALDLCTENGLEKRSIEILIEIGDLYWEESEHSKSNRVLY